MLRRPSIDRSVGRRPARSRPFLPAVRRGTASGPVRRSNHYPYPVQPGWANGERSQGGRVELSGYLAVAKRWWWTLLVATWVAAISGYVVASSIPATYE